MEKRQFSAIFDYLTKQQYPSGFCKSQKHVLRRSSKNYKVEGNKLLYQDFRPDGFTFSWLVICGTEEAERVFMECHLTAGGHKGSGATIWSDTTGQIITKR